MSLATARVEAGLVPAADFWRILAAALRFQLAGEAHWHSWPKGKLC